MEFLIPLNTPICLKAYTGNNIQNEFIWDNARCNNANTAAWEQMIILKTEDGKYIIQSRWDSKNLQVQPNGRCRFVNWNQLLWEKFDVEFDSEGKVYFKSCHTGKYMQCEQNHYAVCANNERGGWEAWRIIYPDSTSIMTHAQLTTISLAATGGIVMCPLLGLAAGALVPAAMSTFGTVVAGRGTMHAALAAGGVAATLQATSAALVTGEAALAGGLIGGGVASAVVLSSANEEDKFN